MVSNFDPSKNRITSHSTILYEITAHQQVSIFYGKGAFMWKDIKGYEGYYQVSDEGEVRRILKDGRTKPVKGKKGLYATVTLSKDNQPKGFAVHRLVAEHFLERPEGKTEVNHIDGDKWNNRVENLEWVTSWENRVHAMEVLHSFPYGKPAKRVRSIDPKTGKVVAEFHSLAEAARSIGKSSAKNSITNVCQGYAEVAYGYRWEYIN